MQIYLPHRRKYHISGNDYSLDLDGVNEVAWTPISIADFNITGTTITLSVWLKLDTNANGVIIQKGDGTAGNNAYYLLIDSNKYLFQIRQNPTTANTLTSTSNVITGSWHHLVATWNGTTSYLYINNSLDKSQANALTGIKSSSTRLYMGGNEFYGGYFLNGKMYHPAVFNTYADASVVSNIHSIKGGSLSGISGIVCAYKFPNGQADHPAWYDYINSHTADLINTEAADIQTDVP